jgi:hypothetical protein
MDIQYKVDVFARLGGLLAATGSAGNCNAIARAGYDAGAFADAIGKAMDANPWFTPASVYGMLYALGTVMERPALQHWLEMYSAPVNSSDKKVAVVMAGNVPAVGFHDFLSVIISGHRLLAKLSSGDAFLIPAIGRLLSEIEPAFENRMEFSSGPLRNFDAVIATGSNNSARYFNDYFAAYPHIIRKNRNALAVISGNESPETLRKLGDDIFLFYGLGCRNVSKLLVPEAYNFDNLFNALEDFSYVADHHKYRNNYDYNKSLYLVNGNPHLDNGFLLLKEDPGLASPVSVLFFETYRTPDQVNAYIEKAGEQIQCVIAADTHIHDGISPGRGQYPRLWDYADGVDTMAFLSEL